MKKIALFTLAASILTACSTAANNEDPSLKTPSSSTENIQTIRFKELWPPVLAERIAIEPAIPAHFILEQSPQAPSTFYWGPKEVLATAFKNPSSLKSPIIKLFLSSGIVQTGPTTFNDDPTKIKANLLTGGMKNVQVQSTMWGDCPVLNCKGTVNGKQSRIAWIGLNDCSQLTICATILYPEKDTTAEKAAMRLWDTFIQKTRQLSPSEFFTANGQDLQPGYTTVSIFGDTVRFVAEKRIRDNEIQFVVIPNSPNIKYSSLDVIQDVLHNSPEWHDNEPILKAYGVLSRFENGKKLDWEEVATTILIKPVDEFSITKEWLEQHPDGFLYQGQVTFRKT